MKVVIWYVRACLEVVCANARVAPVCVLLKLSREAQALARAGSRRIEWVQ